MDIVIPDSPRLELETQNVSDAARSLRVVDDATYRQASELLLAVGSTRREIDATFDPVIDAAHKAHKAALAAKKKHADPVEAAERVIKGKIADYILAEERRRREEEARLQAEARTREEDARLLEAAALEEAGENDLAEAVISAPITVAPVVLPPPPRVSGVSTRTAWGYRIVNPALIPKEYMIPDTVMIGGVVRALKGQTSIPGIEVFEERIVVAASRP